MRRRTAVALLLAPFSAAGYQRSETLEAVEPLAAALSNADAGEFMARIASDAPDRGRLRDNIEALLAYAEVTSSVDLLKVENGQAELDWYMEIKARVTGSVAERRRGTVRVRVRGNRVIELQPVDFFRLSIATP